MSKTTKEALIYFAIFFIAGLIKTNVPYGGFLYWISGFIALVAFGAAIQTIIDAREKKKEAQQSQESPKVDTRNKD
jgi:membrane protein insertase Oxa1/YidC/SpoIIIJ